MASFFRKRIADKVSQAVKAVVCNVGDEVDQERISRLVKVFRGRAKHPQLILPVKSLSYRVPEVQNVGSSQILHAMRNEGLPSAEGIIDIELDQQQSRENFVFTVDRHVFTRIILGDICDEQKEITKTSCLFEDIPRENVVVVFRSPFYGSEFKHTDLRALIHSNFISNICEYVGHNVVKVNHIEDCGPRCSMLLAGCESFSIDNETALNVAGHLSEVLHASIERCKTDERFRRKWHSVMEENADPSTHPLWAKLKSSWMKDINEVYKKLDIEFHETLCDSLLHKKINDTSDLLLEGDYLSCNRGERMFGNLDVVKTSDEDGDEVIDMSIYSIARTVAAAVHLKEYFDFDTLHFVDHECNNENYKTLLSVLEKIGHFWCKDVNFVPLKTVNYRPLKKIPLFSHLLDQVKTCILKELQYSVFFHLEGNTDDLADYLAQAILFIHDMQHKRRHGYSFDYKDLAIWRENAGVSFQFNYADLHERIGKSGETTLDFVSRAYYLDLSYLNEPEALQLVQHLSRFDEFVLKSYTELEPYYLVQYMHSLCYFIEQARDVLELDPKTIRLRAYKARLVLFNATAIILGKSLQLLGIKPMDKFQQ